VATGYYFDYGFLAPEANPSAFPAPEFNDAPHANGLVYPRLYQGIISTRFPDTLAFIGPYRGHSFTAFSNADLTSQAIAQLWLGNYPMPSSSEMEAWCNRNYESSLWQIRDWHIQKVGQSPLLFEKWLNVVAGTAVDYMFSWTSWAAWRFWWRERELYKLLQDGINTPFLYRLFESPRGDKGRKLWDCAREAIYRANGREYKRAKE
jgi:dimethylaniline monooxygenase (N-oxide forming)